MNPLLELFQELSLPALELLEISYPLELLIHQLTPQVHGAELDISAPSRRGSRGLSLPDSKRLLGLFPGGLGRGIRGRLLRDVRRLDLVIEHGGLHVLVSPRGSIMLRLGIREMHAVRVRAQAPRGARVAAPMVLGHRGAHVVVLVVLPLEERVVDVEGLPVIQVVLQRLLHCQALSDKDAQRREDVPRVQR